MKDLSPQTIDLESEKLQFLKDADRQVGLADVRKGRALPRELCQGESGSTR